jgi:predicted HicB family RNase H-like nuclease
MKSRFVSLIKLRAEPRLKEALSLAAEREYTSVSEFVRRELRSALARSGAATDPQQPRREAA